MNLLEDLTGKMMTRSPVIRCLVLFFSKSCCMNLPDLFAIANTNNEPSVLVCVYTGYILLALES